MALAEETGELVHFFADMKMFSVLNRQTTTFTPALRLPAPRRHSHSGPSARPPGTEMTVGLAGTSELLPAGHRE